MHTHYFLLDHVLDWPHNSLHIQKGHKSHQKEFWPVDHFLSHFDEFGYNNFYNTKKAHLIEPHAYKFILNFIHMPVKTDFAVSSESVYMLNNDPKCFLILMSCHEYVITPEALQKTIESYSIPLNKVVVLCSNMEAHGQKINGIHYVCVNFWESFTRFHHRVLPNVPIADPTKKRKHINTASRKYLCLNRNIKPHRIWFYYALIKQEMLEQGHVSYHLPKIDSTEYSTISNSHWVLKRIPQELHDDYKITNARKMYPRMLDRLETEAVINYGNGIENYYKDSVLSFVTESDSTKNFITEKTYKAIVNLHPFFIIGNPEQHMLLRQRGYHTFEELFGVNSVTDYDSAVEMLAHVKSYDLSRLKKTVEKSYFDKLIHNQRNFFSRKVTWTGIVKEIFNAIEKN